MVTGDENWVPVPENEPACTVETVSLDGTIVDSEEKPM
jgi:hypothetical protein